MLLNWQNHKILAHRVSDYQHQLN